MTFDAGLVSALVEAPPLTAWAVGDAFRRIGIDLADVGASQLVVVPRRRTVDIDEFAAILGRAPSLIVVPDSAGNSSSSGPAEFDRRSLRVALRSVHAVILITARGRRELYRGGLAVVAGGRHALIIETRREQCRAWLQFLGRHKHTASLIVDGLGVWGE
jgi:hypothetical protein